MNNMKFPGFNAEYSLKHTPYKFTQLLKAKTPVGLVMPGMMADGGVPRPRPAPCVPECINWCERPDGGIYCCVRIKCP